MWVGFSKCPAGLRWNQGRQRVRGQEPELFARDGWWQLPQVSWEGAKGRSPGKLHPAMERGPVHAAPSDPATQLFFSLLAIRHQYRGRVCVGPSDAHPAPNIETCWLSHTFFRKLIQAGAEPLNKGYETQL